MNPTLLLAIATLALVVGPLFDRIARRVPFVPALVDGATVGGIVVVSFLHLMPEAGAHLSWWALVLLGLGLVLPIAAEKLLEQGGGTLKIPVGVLVVGLLLTHEVIESAALASKANEERVGIATLLVVVGHRLPLGLLLWGQTKRRFGRVWSAVALLGVAAFTWFGPVLVPIEAGTFTAVLSALLAGGLLHLVLQHAPASEHDGGDVKARHAASAAGALLAVLFFVPYLLSGGGDHGHAHAEDVAGLADRLRDLVIESSPYLLVGVLAAAAIEAFWPMTWTQRVRGGSRLRQAFLGVACGAPMPVCSCGVLPIYRSLMHKGVGASAALALLVSAPEIGVDSILLSWKMLGPGVTAARVVCALALALVVGLVVGRIADDVGRRGVEHVHEESRPRGAWAQLRHGLLETWGHLSPWILLGFVLTALVEPWIRTEWAQATPAWVQVIVLSLAGMPTYICAAAATPFAALLLAKGFAPGAVIAFLLTGPATNFTTFGALRRMHSSRVAVAFVLTALAASCGFGIAVDQFMSGEVREAGPAIEHEHGLFSYAAASLLGLLTLWILFRGGPRAFLGQLWSAEEHSHDHGEHGAAPAASAAGPNAAHR